MTLLNNKNYINLPKIVILESIKYSCMLKMLWLPHYYWLTLLLTNMQLKDLATLSISCNYILNYNIYSIFICFSLIAFCFSFLKCIFQGWNFMFQIKWHVFHFSLAYFFIYIYNLQMTLCFIYKIFSKMNLLLLFEVLCIMHRLL